MLGVLMALVMVSGCATRAKVSASNEIATAKFAIRDARASGADTYSLETLQQAEALVEAAQNLGGAEAERLAEKAVAHAQLAATIAQRESARKQLMDAQRMEQEAGALRQRTTQAVEERLQ
jgi:hypothetical protein